MWASRAVTIVVVASVAAAGCGVTQAIVNPVDDARLAAEIRSELERRAPELRTRVDVDVMEGTAYLTGRVDTAQQKATVEAAARGAGVRPVINDIQVRDDAPSALPAVAARHPVLEHLPGVARVEQRPPGPAFAYDRGGRLVATIYTVPVRELTAGGLENLRAPRAIDHVAIYLAESHPDVPLPHYHVVLWHVSAADASALQ